MTGVDFVWSPGGDEVYSSADASYIVTKEYPEAEHLSLDQLELVGCTLLALLYER